MSPAKPVTLREMIDAAKAVTEWGDGNDYERKYAKEFDKLIKTLSDEKNADEILELMLILVGKGHGGMLKINEKILLSRKLINWKKRDNMINALFDKMLEVGALDEEELEACSGHNGDFFEAFINMLKRNKVLEKYLPKLYEILMLAFSSEKETANHGGAFQILLEIPYTTQPYITWSHNILDRVLSYAQDHPDEYYCEGTGMLCYGAVVFLLRSTMDGGGKVKINGIATDYDPEKQIGKEDVLLEFQPQLLEIFNFCLAEEWKTGDDKMTMCGELLKDIMEDYLYRNNSKTEVLKPFMAGVKELLDCGDNELERDANNIMTAIGGNAELLGDDAENVINMYLSGGQQVLITEFPKMYPVKPELFKDKLGRFIKAWKGSDTWVMLSTLTLFAEVAKLHPEHFSADDISEIVSTLLVKDTYGNAFMMLQTLAMVRPTDIMPHDKTIMKAMGQRLEMSSQGANILVELSKLDKSKAEKYMQFLSKSCDSGIQPMYQIALLYAMKSMGVHDIELLKPHREFFERKLSDPQLHDMAQNCINTMEGRSLEAISQEVEEQKEDIEDLDNRVAVTEENVDNLGREVDDTREEVKGLKDDMDQQEERIGDLEEVVEETVEKVEEIDRKTLSHAPTWSRDVARLMNEADDHDWRLMASRLGYTNDDIRNWATQPDPCLSMLDEWFATHKTREATYAVSKILEEMNRIDAAAIVVKALEDTKDLVEDDDEDDDFEPPEVFISYQWGHQQEVKLLQRHLQWAGYKCWMDIGQMGGGDKLYAKLDQGIRAAKVIISCVSEKYAKSPNCNREVNLSVTLGKPIIPLLMEKMSWPPPGTMGPIFSEYLFIRFFTRSGEEAPDERYWAPPKFQELLMQLRYNIAPDESLITGEYKNWWQPPEEIIVIKPREEKKSTSNSTTADSGQESSPDVFISYQWGKQPQIQTLYKVLTSMGYSCWLDIMQMGGGDSLYDKIDKGVRGCKVVLTCVTSKYSISANCRREVSLADAIKKPIIPLLLEKMTWPPEGPMSMVFTQLLYINFCKPDVSIQNHWKVPEFDQLIEKINLHVPAIEANLESTPVVQNADDKQTREENKVMEGSQTEEASKERYEDMDEGDESERKQAVNEEENNRKIETVQQSPQMASPPVVQPKSSCCAIM